MAASFVCGAINGRDKRVLTASRREGSVLPQRYDTTRASCSSASLRLRFANARSASIPLRLRRPGGLASQSHSHQRQTLLADRVAQRESLGATSPPR